MSGAKRKDYLRMSRMLLGLCSLLLLLPSAAQAVDIVKLVKPAMQKKNLGDMLSSTVPYLTVKTPINVSGLPPAWQHAKIDTMALVYFFNPNDPTELVGAGSSEKKVLSVAGADYHSVVNIPITKMQGALTSASFALSLAVLRNVDQCILLGVGKVGAGNGINFANLDEYTGMIMPCSEFSF